ncbi:MAG: hypothetical protein EBU90_23575 [Proteobacteria bacterium]|nr:hypothetical protein [Pseudomonadota bacterium]NBP16197.1 hypothetical protein [bacterium]
MAKLSKFVKVDKNVLLEFIYDEDNNISEAYDVLVNSKERRQSYLATPNSATNNIQGNSLFTLDKLSNKYGKINTSQYSFLQLKNYSSTAPIRHDRLVIHLPINWTFGEYLGCYVRVYTFDTLNQKTFDLSNYYFDMSDSAQAYLLNFTSPPLLFQEKLWGKNLTIDFPAASSLSQQRIGNLPKVNSINANLTTGAGISLTSPVFIDFHFIQNLQTINAVTTYQLSAPITVSIPQTPEFENLGLKIQHSQNGDYFEIFGTYNGNIAEFKQFLDDSVYTGHRYYVVYQITMFEQNIRGKTLTVEVRENFNETVDFRPIIKFSTTTAIIDVEMRLIDAVDDSYITRRATYGMLQDEVSRYALKLIKINLKNANKPKIYNIKNAIDPSLVGFSNAMGKLSLRKRLPPIPMALPVTSNTILSGNSQLVSNPQDTSSGLIANATPIISPNSGSLVGLPNGAPFSQPGITVGQSELASTIASLQQTSPSSGPSVQQIQVDRPILYDRANIVAKSLAGPISTDSGIYYPEGSLKVLIRAVGDTILKFDIARDLQLGGGTAQKIDIFNLSGFSDICFVIKNDTKEVNIPVTAELGIDSVNLKEGKVTFKIPESRYQDIKTIWTLGNRMFYITAKSAGSRFSIYTGLYEISDSPQQQQQLEQTSQQLSGSSTTTQNTETSASTGTSMTPGISLDPSNSAPTTTVASPVSSSPISKEQIPTAKPTGIKEAMDKFKRPMRKL